MTVIVSIQATRNGHNHDRYLRAVVEEETPDAIRKAVTLMMRKPADFDLSGKKYGMHRGRKPAKTAKVIRPDDESAEPQELQAT